MSERIVVTGATGKVGTQTVLKLLEARASVRAVVRNPEKASTLAEAGAEIVMADFGEPSTLKSAFEGANRALLISTGGPDLPDLQSHAVDALKQAGVSLIVKVSAFEADPQSEINIARWHGQVEEHIRTAGTPFIFLRPTGFMQNLLGMSPAIRQGSFKTCRTDGREAMVDARDVAEVAASVLLDNKHRNQTFTLTGPESLTIDEITAQIATVAGRPFSPDHVSEDEYRAMMLGYGLPEWILNDLIAWGRQHQPVSGDVSAILGRDATPLSQFLQDHAGTFCD